MGERGPNRVPLEIHQITGSTQQYRRKGEPVMQSGDPEPPDWLSERAQSQWARMVERLRGMQVLSPAYREALAQFCEAWADYESLVIQCREEPFIIESDKGGLYLNPWHGAKAKAWDRVMKMGKEFGYTPSAKAELRVEGVVQNTSKKRFFKGAS